MDHAEREVARELDSYVQGAAPLAKPDLGITAGDALVASRKADMAKMEALANSLGINQVLVDAGTAISPVLKKWADPATYNRASPIKEIEVARARLSAFETPGATTRFSVLRGEISGINDAVDAAIGNGEKEKARILTEFLKELRVARNQAAGTATDPTTGQKLPNFAADYADFNRQYKETIHDRHGVYQDIRMRNMTDASGPGTAENIVDTFWGPNKSSVLESYLEVGGPQAREFAANAAMLSFQKEVVKNGTITDTAFNAWAKKHKDNLDLIPEVRDDINSFKEQILDGLANDFQMNKARYSAVVDGELNKRLARFIQGRDPDALFEGMLANPVYAREFVKQVKDDPAALAALRREVWDRVVGNNIGAVGMDTLQNAKPALQHIFEPQHLEDLETLFTGWAAVQRTPMPRRAAQVDRKTFFDKILDGATTYAAQERLGAAGVLSQQHIMLERGLRILRGAKGRAQREIFKKAVYDSEFAKTAKDAGKGNPGAARKLVIWLGSRPGTIGTIGGSSFQEPGEVQQTPVRTRPIRSINTEVDRNLVNGKVQERMKTLQDEFREEFQQLFGGQ